MKLCAHNNFGGFVIIDVGRDVAEAEAEVEAEARTKDVGIAVFCADVDLGVPFLFVSSCRKYCWTDSSSLVDSSDDSL